MPLCSLFFTISSHDTHETVKLTCYVLLREPTLIHVPVVVVIKFHHAVISVMQLHTFCTSNMSYYTNLVEIQIKSSRKCTGKDNNREPPCSFSQKSAIFSAKRWNFRKIYMRMC